MRFDAQAKYAFIVACITLVGSGLGFRVAVGYLNYYLSKERVDLREHFANIPRTLNTWRAVGQDQQHDAAMIESLGTDLYLDRVYVRDGESGAQQAMLHLAYYTGMIDMIPHVPDRCMVAGGFEPVGHTRTLDLPVDTSSWRSDPTHVNRKSGEPYPVATFTNQITGRPITVRMPLGEFGLRTTEFRLPSQPNARIFAGFFFVANGHVTPDPLAVRWLAFDRTDRFAYYCKVQVTMIGDADFDEDQFIAAAASLVSELLPEVMRCLPDWAEVEMESVSKGQVASVISHDR